LTTHCVAFSVGALIAIRVADQTNDASFKRMLLLAPPVGIRVVPKLVRMFVPLWRVGLGLPSAAPRNVRQRRSTPFSEYGALLRIYDGVRPLNQPARLRVIPTLVRVDRRDELVRYAAVESWIDANQLNGPWDLKDLPDRQTSRRTYKHLIVSRESLGDVEWGSLTDAMVRHLSG
jgi:hypothetical protein